MSSPNDDDPSIFETSAQSSGRGEGTLPSYSYSSFCRRLAIVSTLASVGLIIWMFVGGLVYYVPGLSAIDMQNIYLSRILWYGTASVILQLVTIGLFYRSSKL